MTEAAEVGAVDNVGTILGARVGLVDTLGLSVGPVYQENKTELAVSTQAIDIDQSIAIHHTLCNPPPLLRPTQPTANSQA